MLLSNFSFVAVIIPQSFSFVKSIYYHNFYLFLLDCNYSTMTKVICQGDIYHVPGISEYKYSKDKEQTLYSDISLYTHCLSIKNINKKRGVIHPIFLIFDQFRIPFRFISRFTSASESYPQKELLIL